VHSYEGITLQYGELDGQKLSNPWTVLQFFFKSASLGRDLQRSGLIIVRVSRKRSDYARAIASFAKLGAFASILLLSQQRHSQDRSNQTGHEHDNENVLA